MPGCSVKPASSSAASPIATIFVTTVPSMSWPSRPTRSGKGVGLVVPTLLTWTGSAVIHDIKGENWELTAGWRARFSHCLLFNPTDRALGALQSAARGPARAPTRSATSRTSPTSWSIRKARSSGATIGKRPATRCSSARSCTCSTPRRRRRWRASRPSSPIRSGRFDATLRRHDDHQSSRHDDAPRFIRWSPRPRASCSTSPTMSARACCRPPCPSSASIAIRPSPRSPSRCDWRIADLLEASRPVSLYLVVPPSDISRTKPLIRLVLNQIGRRLTEELRSVDGRPARQLLMMLDEFPALGRLDFFETALAFMAGYGVRAFLIAQSLNQIEKAYGEHNSILDNCHVRVAFATNDERTAKRISDALGTATEQRAMRNYAGHRLAPWLAPRHGQPAGDRAAAADPRRGHAAAADRRAGAGRRHAADPRAEAALLSRTAASQARVLPRAGPRRWHLCRPSAPDASDDWAGVRAGPTPACRAERRARRLAGTGDCSSSATPAFQADEERQARRVNRPIRSALARTRTTSGATAVLARMRGRSQPSWPRDAINQGSDAATIRPELRGWHHARRPGPLPTLPAPSLERAPRGARRTGPARPSRRILADALAAWLDRKGADALEHQFRPRGSTAFRTSSAGSSATPASSSKASLCSSATC